MNPLNGQNSVAVVSTWPKAVESASLVITCVGLDGTQHQSHYGPFAVPPLKTTQLKGVSVPRVASSAVTFAKMELFTLERSAKTGLAGTSDNSTCGSSGAGGGEVLLSRNVYWLSSSSPSSPKAPPDFSPLQAWRVGNAIKIEARILEQDEAALVVELANRTGTVAFWVELKVVKEEGEGEGRSVGNALCSEDLILPIFYSENYVTLFPQESRRVRIEADESLKRFTLAIQGWNVQPIHFSCSANTFL